MKRILFVLMAVILAIASFATISAATSVKIQIFNGTTSSSSNTITPNFKLVNTGTDPISLSNVKMRYYFTNDGAQAGNFACDWCSVSNVTVTGTFVNINPVTGADRYLEIGFTGAGTLAAGAAVEVKSRVWKSDWSNFTQTNDYSFNASATNYTDSTTVTAYISGTLYWGTSPGGSQATATPTQTAVRTATPTPTASSTPTPGTSVWIKVDDNHPNVSYSSGWGVYTGNPGYQNTEHYSETTGSVATFTFIGTQARFYGFKRNDLGYAEISVDDVVKASIDCYGGSTAYNTILYQTDPLPSGTHTLKVKVAGTRNGSSAGIEVICDAFEYLGDASQITPTPTPGGTTGNITYTLVRASSPTQQQLDAYAKITAAMDTAVQYYNTYTTRCFKRITVYYEPSVPTADGNSNGTIRFGGTSYMNHISAMHEIAHTLGVGTTSTWTNVLIRNGIYTGANATAQLRAITGNSSDEIHGDSQHFWPYGLNYTSEVSSNADLVNHCKIVDAMKNDGL
jgi:hypothetical protein